MKLEPLESRGLRELVKELVFQLQQNSFVEKVDLGDFLIFQCTNRTGVLAGQREAAWFSWQSAKQVRREKKQNTTNGLDCYKKNMPAEDTGYEVVRGETVVRRAATEVVRKTGGGMQSSLTPRGAHGILPLVHSRSALPAVSILQLE